MEKYNIKSKSVKEPKKQYFHLTSKENSISILQNGLKANKEGDIFLFENKTITAKFLNKSIAVADHIALNQIGLDEFVMFSIKSKGINGEIINDNVGEITSRQQWILKQNFIKPEHIDVYGIFKPIGWF